MWVFQPRKYYSENYPLYGKLVVTPFIPDMSVHFQTTEPNHEQKVYSREISLVTAEISLDTAELKVIYSKFSLARYGMVQ